MQTNPVILERANALEMLLNQIKFKKISYLGHVLRKVLQLIMMGKTEARRYVGRRQGPWLKNIRGWTGIQSAEHLFRLAKTKEEFATVIANVRDT